MILKNTRNIIIRRSLADTATVGGAPFVELRRSFNSTSTRLTSTPVRADSDRPSVSRPILQDDGSVVRELGTRGDRVPGHRVGRTNLDLDTFITFDDNTYNIASNLRTFRQAFFARYGKPQIDLLYL